MAFAVLTGLLYGRFSKPTAYLKFSDNMLISPFKDSKALMFRLAPFKNNSLTDAAVKLNVAIKMEENGKFVNKYFTLEPDLNTINSLALSWTIVHVLNESSPLYGLSLDDFKNNEIEILVFVEAYDEHFSNTVKTKTSYVANDIVDNAKFIPMYRQTPDKQKTLLEINRINEFKILN
jgi:inward rectifier potassium channel